MKPATQVVSLEDLAYFNVNQRPELEEAEKQLTITKGRAHLGAN